MSSKLSPESARNIAGLAADLLVLLQNQAILQTIFKVVLDKSVVMRLDARHTALGFSQHLPEGGVLAALGEFVCKASILLADVDDVSVRQFLCDYHTELYRITAAVKLLTYRKRLAERVLADNPEPITPRDTNNSIVRLAHSLELYVSLYLEKDLADLHVKAARTSRAFSSLATIDQLEESVGLTEAYFSVSSKRKK